MLEDNPGLQEEYTAVSFVAGNSFPITKKDSLTLNESEDKKNGFDPNAINNRLADLVRMVHGSLESKPKIIDEFNEQFPECSKNSIERKLKSGFIKDKRGDDPRFRYYATDETLDQL